MRKTIISLPVVLVAGVAGCGGGGSGATASCRRATSGSPGQRDLRRPLEDVGGRQCRTRHGAQGDERRADKLKALAARRVGTLPGVPRRGLGRDPDPDQARRGGQGQGHRDGSEAERPGRQGQRESTRRGPGGPAGHLRAGLSSSGPGSRGGGTSPACSHRLSDGHGASRRAARLRRGRGRRGAGRRPRSGDPGGCPRRSYCGQDSVATSVELRTRARRSVVVAESGAAPNRRRIVPRGPRGRHMPMGVETPPLGGG